MNPIAILTAWFKSQIGVTETPIGSNNVIYNTWYYGHEVIGDAYAWCMAFIWAAFMKTGLSKLFLNGGKSAYCPYVMSWAMQHGRWFTSGYREGDIALIDWDGDGVADHVEYVISDTGDFAVTIGGNRSDKVQQSSIAHRYILGVYRPDYESTISASQTVHTATETEAPASTTQTAGPSSAASSNGLDESGMYIVQKGDTLWGIAAKFLGNGMKYREIQKENNLFSTALYIGQRLKIPGFSKPTPAEDVSTDPEAPASGATDTNIWNTYTVRPGDTLWSIADAMLGGGWKYKQIMEANGLTSTIILPVQTLKIPK